MLLSHILGKLKFLGYMCFVMRKVSRQKYAQSVKIAMHACSSSSCSIRSKQISDKVLKARLEQVAS